MIGLLVKGIVGLFGSSKSTGTALEAAADGLSNGIDKLVYTQEEKAEAMQGARATFLEFAKVAHDQNSIRSVTRRWLAFMIVGPTMLFYVGSAFFHGIGTFTTMPVVTGQAIAVVPAATTYALFLFKLAGELTPWAGGVLAFYFGSHLIGARK